MDNIIIEATNETPEIRFDIEKGEVSLTGKSYPENVHETYKELLDAIEVYCTSPKKDTTVNYKWLYYNTATSKIIVKILLALKKADTNLHVNWFCKNDFTMMIEKAEVFKDILNIEINIQED